MAGSQVTREILDMRASEAVVAVRGAFRKVENIQAFLANQTDVDVNGTATDPLTLEPFSYTPDEAYVIRLVFGDLDYARSNLNTTMTNGRKLTGLE